MINYRIVVDSCGEFTEDMKNRQETTSKYIEYLDMLKKLSNYSGAVYTQLSDVEGEVNGLSTYDRKEIKVDESVVKKANRELIRLFSNGDDGTASALTAND